MKKSNRPVGIWTVKPIAPEKASAKKTHPQLSTHNKILPVKAWTTATQKAKHSTKESASLKPNSARKSPSLEALEEELNSDTTLTETVTSEKRDTAKGKALRSWVDIIKEHQFQSKAFSDTVSMQGLGPIFDPKSSGKRKLVWMTIVLMALLFTGFNILTQIAMYVDKPITVRVDFRKAEDLTFPTVTLCNNNFASLATASHFHAVLALQRIKPLVFQEKEVPDFAALEQQVQYFRAAGWEVFYHLLAQNMSQMLLSCQWEQTPCSLSNFTTVFTDMGLCYSFNYEGSLKVREAGRAYGLKLTLDIKQDDYLRSMDEYYGAGFRVQVHAQAVPPIMAEKGVAVSPGHHNFLAVDVKHLKNAEPSISDCGSRELQYYRESSARSYSTEACRLECRTRFMEERCQCRSLYMPNKDLRICDPDEFYYCYNPTLHEYFQTSNQCENLCPEPCAENQYRVTPSSNPLSQHFLSEVSTLRGHNVSYWSRNLLHLEIYLSSMTYELVEKQLAYTILQLFCDVGGAFGLLLGASLLTLLEIVDFFLCAVSASQKKGGGGGGGGGGGDSQC